MLKRDLTLDKFYSGLIDEEQIAKLSVDANVCTEVKNIIWMPTGGMRGRVGVSKLHDEPFHGHRIKSVKQVMDEYNIPHTLVFTAVPSGVAEIGTVISSGSQYAFEDITPTDFWEVQPNHTISFTTIGNSAVFTYSDSDGPLCVWKPGQTAVSTLTNSPSGAKITCGFGTYLFVANYIDEGVQRIYRVRWSAANQPNEWPEDYYMDLDPFDGDEITAMYVYKDKLLVFKRYKVFAIYWTGGEMMFKAAVISDAAGCLSPNAIAYLNNNLYWIGEYAFYRYTGKGMPEPIGFQIQPIIDNMNLDARAHFEAESYDPDQLVLFNLALGTSEENNAIICYDARYDSMTMFEFSFVPTTFSAIDATEYLRYMHLPLPYQEYSSRIRETIGYTSGELIFGTNDGYLYRYGYVTNDLDQPIELVWKSKWIDCGIPKINKRLYNVTLIADRESANIRLDIFTDWNDSIPVFTTIESLEGGIDQVAIERRIDMTIPFRVLKIRLSMKDLNHTFSISKIILSFSYRGDQHEKETLNKQIF